jgi:type II secretory pathway component PulF
MSVSLSNSEKLTLFSSLGNMLGSGIPLLEAMESLQLLSNKRQKKILASLYHDIEQGNTLTDSFSKFPETFDTTILAVLHGAEEAGTLDQTLQDIVTHLEQQIEFEERIKEALTYPFFVLFVFFGVVLLMLLFVIPRIATIFDRLRVPLPGPTQFLVNVSFVLRTYPIPVGAVGLLVIGVSWYLYRNHQRAVTRFFFSLPVISTLGTSIDLARFFRSLSLLLSAGIPITEGIELSSRVVAQKKLMKVFQHTQEVVLAGKNISEGLLAEHGVVNPIVVRMVSAGEKSGTLEKSTAQVSDFFEKEVKKNLKRVTVLLEPLLILLIGVLVGGMMLSIIAPIYGLIGQIGGR